MTIVHKCITSPACWLGGLLLILGGLSNLGAVGVNASPAAMQDKAEEAKAAEQKMLREGTRIEQRPAQVRQEAERLAITMDGMKNPLLALENLAMQRLHQAVLDDPNDKNWIVTGTVTEYQGRNFLLLERVTRAARQ